MLRNTATDGRLTTNKIRAYEAAEPEGGHAVPDPDDTNVHSGGRYLVYETGAQGLVVASVLERVGGRGSVTHIYQTGQPQTAWPPWTSLPRFSATSTS